MAERGVIVEFDFTVLNGAELLFQTAKSFLDKLDGIGFDERIEARYLSGKSYLDGFGKLFPVVKTKKTPQKASRDFTAAFSAAVTEAFPSAQSMAFRNFVKVLTDAGLKVVIVTHADTMAVGSAFASVLGEKVSLFQDISSNYGMSKADLWYLACRANGLTPGSTLLLTGSGFGVKEALRAGMRSTAVVNDRVAWHDFGGADDVLPELSGKTARRILERLGR